MLVLMVISTHYAWALRQQLYEARTVGRYQLRRRLGAGGMGEAWSAYYPALKREVALKFLRHTGDAEALARFEREARATAALSHPNTVRVFDDRRHPGLFLRFILGRAETGQREQVLGERLEPPGGSERLLDRLPIGIDVAGAPERKGQLAIKRGQGRPQLMGCVRDELVL
jgi:hypothetical protein